MEYNTNPDAIFFPTTLSQAHVREPLVLEVGFLVFGRAGQIDGSQPHVGSYCFVVASSSSSRAVAEL